jgi:glycosyltransferase involved in cell wall biosynthesis
LIVTDVPGCRQFVRDGVEGLVVPPEDASALAEAIGTLADDAALRRRMGMAARKRVLSGYTKGHIISATSGVYRRILLDSKGISGGHKKR